MIPVNQNLHALLQTLMDAIQDYGIQEISLGQYKTVCRKIESFAKERGTSLYSLDLMDEYRGDIWGRSFCHDAGVKSLGIMAPHLI